MSEEDQCIEMNTSDIVEASEQCLENSVETTEVNDSLPNNVQEIYILNSEDVVFPEKKTSNVNKTESLRSTKLPLGRIKNIMKMDPDVSVVNTEAVFLVAEATELFLKTIAKETYTYTMQHKRKLISKKDLEVVINKVDCLCFLEGAMDF